jgi:hypothetical protein
MIWRKAFQEEFSGNKGLNTIDKKERWCFSEREAPPSLFPFKYLLA